MCTRRRIYLEVLCRTNSESKMALRFLCRNSFLRHHTLRSCGLRNSSSSSGELLENRQVLTVRRESCEDFLQGLITNDMRMLSTHKCLYTMMLNHKGRVLYDSMIYKTEEPDTVHVECCVDVADAMAKHFKLYSLRKKIEVVKSRIKVWAVYQETGGGDEVVADPRCAEPWVHRCLSESQPVEKLIENSYLSLRFSLGIAEGSKEIPVGETFPLENNADFLNGVSFDKGCYVGQELTARVHHTGVVRKRIMPLELVGQTNEDLSFEEPVIDSASGKSVGRVRGLNGNRALALMRVKETVSSKGLVWCGVEVKAVIPHWWPPLSKESSVESKS